MTYCVYCGAALADTHRCQQCGAYRQGDTWHEGGGSVPETAVLDSGWRPDPTGRHEDRYYAGGAPTDLVRDGGVETIDAVGKEQLIGAGEVINSGGNVTRTRRRLMWTVVAVLTVLAIAGGATALALYLTRDRESVDDKYLTAVRGAGLAAEFNSNANAVAHAKQVCRKLEDGAPQQGMPVDEVAVEYYCPQFSEGFHVLETAYIAGTFTLNDDSPSYVAPSIEVSGSSCVGAGGYSDIGPGTQVTVKNGQGDVLATTELEPGTGGRFLCTFPFSFEVTEGEDRYIISVSRRGDMSYTFGELKSNGVVLTLGGR
ncbi:DUF732 domain-containing protein [Mycolicibacterium mengxianglii]|uniref:DUF732 domain-containing protein n=1 Tax=Mycolicibacterium mengxianglii TaxID=2736649 RepID=UPI0018D05271|nr:DUF732 domain-containing protein [Mycolicibacterium mengxianglii]